MNYKMRVLKSSKNRSNIHTAQKCYVRNETQWKQNALCFYLKNKKIKKINKEKIQRSKEDEWSD